MTLWCQPLEKLRTHAVELLYADEEFLLILPNTSEENTFLFAEHFRRDIEKMEFIPAGEEEKHPVTISGGISTYPCLENVEEDAYTIIRYAEHALYNAKKRGKNKIVQFSQINLDY
ncbi:MAG: diguanylate cyclase [Candidatus Gastranaerophilales bacterium]|nr:diguanylate cyclase [Candidatus Gastranaerophilales bacterium]